MFNMKNITMCLGCLFIISRIYIGITVLPEFWVDVYKDMAHIFIGVLGTIWWYKRESWQWGLFWLLNVVEVAVAILSR